MQRIWSFFGTAVMLTLAASTAFAISYIGTSGFNKAEPVAIAHPHTSIPGRIVFAATDVEDAISKGELDREVKSILRVDHVLHHGDFVWNEANVPDGPVWVRVDLKKQLISAFRAGHEIGTAVTLYGVEEKETPSGRFRVTWKRKEHRSRTYDADMPYTLRLTDDGISIHGSDVLSGRATHGCIGVPVQFARHLFRNVAVGDEVVILS